ncbi:hypothetical protein DFQ27_002447, partial [Actinomortierella ambigua]
GELQCQATKSAIEDAAYLLDDDKEKKPPSHNPPSQDPPSQDSPKKKSPSKKSPSKKSPSKKSSSQKSLKKKRPAGRKVDISVRIFFDNGVKIEIVVFEFKSSNATPQTLETQQKKSLRLNTAILLDLQKRGLDIAQHFPIIID